MVHEQLRVFFNGFRRDAHPMAIMTGVVGALSASTTTPTSTMGGTEISAHRLIAKMLTLAAMSYRPSATMVSEPATRRTSCT